MHKNLRKKSQIIQKGVSLSVQDVSGTYIAPDIEVIDIEIEQSFLQSGSTGDDMPGDEL
ncbi:MAG: hypothetical protein VB075_03420 [Petrimonas sp.]|uniref:hypothetical protein n=1 Tax=Petrimonas sp. TaxID=2023866 RepID=UPI002B389C91|nr:hypothetical protein [Petrimonas sp.]MEA5043617.1 hypothetical protein [Petrimonas sp.]